MGRNFAHRAAVRRDWFIVGFVWCLALIAVLQKLGVHPGGPSGWWLIPILALTATGYAVKRAKK